LIVTGARVLSFIAPESKPTSLGVLLEALAFSAHTHDADRSGLSEFEAANWVLEHMAPTAPLSGIVPPNGTVPQVGATPGHQLDQISALARTRLSQGPFAATALQQSGQPSSPLRQYLAAFGISSPARLQQDRVKTDHALCLALDKISITRPRATRLYVCSPTPDATSLATMRASLLKLPRRHVHITWVRVPYEYALDALEQHPPQTANADTLRAVTSAVKIRMQVLQEHGEKSLRRLGVRVQPVGFAHRATFRDPEL
jgi:hypothetical protein